jgi:hypothetical protein
MKKIVLTTALLLSLGSVKAPDSVRWDSVSLSYESADLDGATWLKVGLIIYVLINMRIIVK